MVTIFLFFQLILGDVVQVDAFTTLAECEMARKEAAEYYEMGKRQVPGFKPPVMVECVETVVPKPQDPGEPA